MAELYRVGIIGRTGRGNYGHAIDVAWKTHPRARIVGVADDDAAGLAKAGERLESKALFADYRRMIAETKPQIVAVCPRWIDAHLEMVLAAAEAHASIFMEKPMAPTPAQCDRMIDACDRVHARISIGHNNRICPMIDVAERQVRDGLIGDIQEIRGRGKEDRRAGGEDMMVLGTHVFDLMRRFAGDPQWVFGRVYQQGRELRAADVRREGPEGMGPIGGDQIEATFGMQNGVTGYFASKKSSEAGGKRFGLDVMGSKGILAIRCGHIPEIWLNRSAKWTGENWERLAMPPGTRPHDQNDAYHVMIDDLLEAIEGRREPVAGGRNARWTIEMAMGIYASHRSGGRVAFPLVNREHPLA